jgi:type IV secretion system protein VirB1
MFQTLTVLIATCAPAVHPTTLRALIAVESAANPYAVSLNRPEQLWDAGLMNPGDVIGRQPTSLAEALQLTRRLLQRGLTTSVGLAQINIEHAPRLHLTLAQLFDPCINLQVAQQILLDCDRAQRSPDIQVFTTAATRLQRTLSCYNAGNYRTGFTNGYVERVLRAATRLHAVTLIAQR